MENLNSVLPKIEKYFNELSKMNSNSHTCNQLYDHIKETIIYIGISGVENNNRGDSCQNQLLDSIAGISPKAKYGLNSKKSISLFNNTQSEALWFLEKFLTSLRKM